MIIISGSPLFWTGWFCAAFRDGTVGKVASVLVLLLHSFPAVLLVYVREPWMLKYLCRRGTRPRILSKKRLREVQRLRLELLPDGGFIFWLLFQCVLKDLRLGAHEWHAPRNQVVEDDAEAPYVGLLVVLVLAREYFGRHVAEGAADLLVLDVGDAARHAKICQL